MKVIGTLEYFNLTIEEAQRKNSDGYTKEECKVLDCGLEWHFYDSFDGLVDGYEFYYKRAIQYDYDITVFHLSDGRYVVVLS